MLLRSILFVRLAPHDRVIGRSWFSSGLHVLRVTPLPPTPPESIIQTSWQGVLMHFLRGTCYSSGTIYFK